MYFIGLFGGLGERMYWEKQLSLPVKKCGAFSLYGDEGWGLILEWTLLVVFSIHLLTCFSLWEPVMIKDRTIHPLWCLKKKKTKTGRQVPSSSPALPCLLQLWHSSVCGWRRELLCVSRLCGEHTRWGLLGAGPARSLFSLVYFSCSDCKTSCWVVVSFAFLWDLAIFSSEDEEVPFWLAFPILLSH